MDLKQKLIKDIKELDLLVGPNEKFRLKDYKRLSSLIPEYKQPLYIYREFGGWEEALAAAGLIEDGEYQYKSIDWLALEKERRKLGFNHIQAVYNLPDDALKKLNKVYQLKFKILCNSCPAKPPGGCCDNKKECIDAADDLSFFESG